MSDIASVKRQLKIKAGAVSRLFKEHNLYREEAQEQRLKLNKLTADNADGWDVRNATRMAEECDKMIVDSSTRLGKAVGELRDLLVSAKQDTNLHEDEDLLKAEEALELASV